MSKNLPKYSVGEERMNFITHLIGAVLSVFALVYCVYVSVAKDNMWGVVSSVIYGLTMLIMYSASSIYHGTSNPKLRGIFRKLDHCSIFLLIAGTYTPILLCALRPGYPKIAWALFAVVWITAILGVILNSISVERFAKFSMFCYIAMGWCIVLALKPMLDSIERNGFLLILAGGISYTIGAVLYGIGKRKVQYMHGVFHVFVLIGTILHFLAIIWYIL